MVMLMKKIVNVVGLESQEDVEKLDEQLKTTRLNYSISLVNQCIIVDGGADEVRVATFAVERAGFNVL